MKVSYYVVFDGTSAYVVDSSDIDNIETDPYAMESVYGPFDTFEEASDREDEINHEAGVYYKEK